MKVYLLEFSYYAPLYNAERMFFLMCAKGKQHVCLMSDVFAQGSSYMCFPKWAIVNTGCTRIAKYTKGTQLYTTVHQGPSFYGRKHGPRISNEASAIRIWSNSSGKTLLISLKCQTCLDFILIWSVNLRLFIGLELYSSRKVLQCLWSPVISISFLNGCHILCGPIIEPQLANFPRFNDRDSFPRTGRNPLSYPTSPYRLLPVAHE